MKRIFRDRGEPSTLSLISFAFVLSFLFNYLITGSQPPYGEWYLGTGFFGMLFFFTFAFIIALKTYRVLIVSMLLLALTPILLSIPYRFLEGSSLSNAYEIFASLELSAMALILAGGINYLDGVRESRNSPYSTGDEITFRFGSQMIDEEKGLHEETRHSGTILKSTLTHALVRFLDEDGDRHEVWIVHDHIIKPESGSSDSSE